MENVEEQNENTTENTTQNEDNNVDNTKEQKIPMIQQLAAILDEMVEQCVIAGGAVFNQDNCELKYRTHGYRADTNDCRILQLAYSNPIRTHKNGFEFMGRVFHCVRNDSQSTYGRCGNSIGVLVRRASGLILVCSYDSRHAPGITVHRFEDVGDYVESIAEMEQEMELDLQY